jgi:hypothetical protein
MFASKKIVWVLVLLVMWCAACESSTDKLQRAYAGVVNACAAGDTEALWSMSAHTFKQTVDLYAAGFQALGAADLEQIFGYQGNPKDFSGRDYLKGVMAKGDDVDNPCSYAKDWQVVETGVIGEKYVLGLSRPDGRIFGLKLVNQNGRWMLDEITKSRSVPKVIAGNENLPPIKAPPSQGAPEPPLAIASDEVPPPGDDAAAANRNIWLTGSFRCRAISTVRFRKCQFKKTDTGYSLKFQNDVRCKDVEFDENGHPAKLLGCRSKWLKIPKNNKLKKQKNQNIWAGSYSGWWWEDGDKYCCPGMWLEAPAALTETKN